MVITMQGNESPCVMQIGIFILKILSEVVPMYVPRKFLLYARYGLVLAINLQHLITDTTQYTIHYTTQSFSKYIVQC